MESGLASTSTSSFSTIGWIPSGPIDLCVSIWHSRSLTIYPWILGISFCSPSLFSCSGDCVSGEQLPLLLKTETKKALSTSALPHPLSLSFPWHLIEDGDSPSPSFCDMLLISWGLYPCVYLSRYRHTLSTIFCPLMRGLLHQQLAWFFVWGVLL